MDKSCAEIKDHVIKHGLLERLDPDECPLNQLIGVGSLDMWLDNRPVFKELVTWLVKDQHLSLSSRFATDIVRDLLCKCYTGIPVRGNRDFDLEQLESIDFFMSLGYEFPSAFYMGTYTFHRPCARLCTAAHARLMDTGMSVSPAWQHAHMPGDAQFIYMVWKMRRDCGLACVALISVLRKKRRDLGMCVNADVLKIIIAAIWRHRWDELGLPSLTCNNKNA